LDSPRKTADTKATQLILQISHLPSAITPHPSDTLQSPVQVNKTLSPGTMRAEPLAAICAKLIGKINEDKEQLRSVLGYLHDFDCDSEPAASTTQCVELKRKQAALESRIEANQRTARARGCR
jgi:hypothetical protein